MDVFWAAPPVIRTIVAATLLISIPVYTNLLPYHHILFYLPFLLKGQAWRLITSFLLTGPQLGMLMDPYFLWTYGSALESDSPRFGRSTGGRFGGMAVYVAFVVGFILLVDGVLLSGVTFLHCLTVAFAYTYGQDNSGRSVSFFIVTFSARYLPLAMLAMTFVTGGPPAAMHQVTGLLAAHAYDFLTRIWPAFGGGKNVLEYPAQLVGGWYGESEGPRVGTTTSRGTRFDARPQQPAAAAEAGSGATWTSGFSNTWGTRGAGRRLGGD